MKCSVITTSSMYIIHSKQKKMATVLAINKHYWINEALIMFFLTSQAPLSQILSFLLVPQHHHDRQLKLLSADR